MRNPLSVQMSPVVGEDGCLETYAAISAITDALRPQHGKRTLAQLMRLLAARDPGAVRVVGDAGELVGMHLAAVCNLLAPRRVIVIGPMAQAGELALDETDWLPAKRGCGSGAK